MKANLFLNNLNDPLKALKMKADNDFILDGEGIGLLGGEKEFVFSV